MPKSHLQRVWRPIEGVTTSLGRAANINAKRS